MFQCTGLVAVLVGPELTGAESTLKNECSFN